MKKLQNRSRKSMKSYGEEELNSHWNQSKKFSITPQAA